MTQPSTSSRGVFAKLMAIAQSPSISPILRNTSLLGHFLLDEMSPALSRRAIFAKIEDIQTETHDSKTYTLKVPKRWGAFVAGTHVPITREINGTRFQRRYTISSTPEQLRKAGTISFTSKRVEDGLVSNDLFESAKPGDWVEVNPAEGDFTYSQATGKRLLFLAAGSGITPFYAMLRTHLQQTPQSQITLLYFCRSEKDVIFSEGLQQLARTHANFELTILFSSQSEKLSMENLRLYCPDIDQRHVFLCGPAGFMALANDILTNYFKLPESAISQEFFGLPKPDSRHVASQDNALDNPEKTQKAADTAGLVTFTQSGKVVQSDGSKTLLELAEDAGLSPSYGCRAGRCHQCKCLKVEGRVKDIRNGQLSEAGAIDIQPCISLPLGAVEVQL